MALTFELDGVDPEKLGAGMDFAEPGSYHFEVLGVMENDPRNGATWVDLEVLAGTTKNQEGKTHREYLNKRTVIEFAVAIGLTSYDEIKRHIAAGTSPEIDLEGKAIGRQLCGGIQPETFEGKTRNKLSFRMWAVDSPKAKGIPLNKGKLAEFNAMLASSGGTDDPFGGGVDPVPFDAPAPRPSVPGPADDLFT